MFDIFGVEATNDEWVEEEKRNKIVKSSTLLMIDIFLCWLDRVFMTWELNDTANIEISLNTPVSLSIRLLDTF